ncbi:uncharacterized protein LOC108590822 [Callithrix jacchus]
MWVGRQLLPHLRPGTRRQPPPPPPPPSLLPPPGFNFSLQDTLRESHRIRAAFFKTGLAMPLQDPGLRPRSLLRPITNRLGGQCACACACASVSVLTPRSASCVA